MLSPGLQYGGRPAWAIRHTMCLLAAAGFEEKWIGLQVASFRCTSYDRLHFRSWCSSEVPPVCFSPTLATDPMRKVRCPHLVWELPGWCKSAVRPAQNRTQVHRGVDRHKVQYSRSARIFDALRRSPLLHRDGSTIWNDYLYEVDLWLKQTHTNSTS